MTSTVTVKEENAIQQAWHSLGEAFHLRESTPPPVPPKDERWLVRTQSLALPDDQESDVVGFWDKIVLRITSLHTQAHTNTDSDDDEEQEFVSINVPADAALDQLGVSDDDDHLQEKKNYFKRMATRCKEKFEQDSNNSESILSFSEIVVDEDDSSQDRPYHYDHPHLERYLHALRRHFGHSDTEHKVDDTFPGQRRRHHLLKPKVDPREMRDAHRFIYHHKHKQGHEAISADDNSSIAEDNEEAEGRKLFGSWWGCRTRPRPPSKQDPHSESALDDEEWEKVELPTSKEKKRRSLLEQNGAVPLDPSSTAAAAAAVAAAISTGSRPGSGSTNKGKNWWFKSHENDAVAAALTDRPLSRDDRKAITKRRQAIAAAAAYEAMKEYQARKVRQGKKVSHGEMKAILAGMAMAEAVKLLESRHNGGAEEEDDDDAQKDETVAEAGSKALKLFELLR
ncbi:hypothetical protein BGZ50_004975 [Haplosporangium sp. Z 11]|nr:hypothetical protein BGZ50_004975 [Haplosporangium sp. Z 11]